MHFQTSDQEKLELGFGGYTCNWGLHICGLYETEKERDEIIMGFLHEGDVNNDLQIYFPSERTEENFNDEYGKRYPACKDHVHNTDLFSVNNYRVITQNPYFIDPDEWLSKYDPEFIYK